MIVHPGFVRKPEPLPPILRVRPFRVGEGLARGAARSRLYAADLRRPFHGVRTLQPPQSLLDRMTAYRARMADNEFFSHVTSGLYFGVPLPAWLERRTTLHVSVVAPARPPHTRGVAGHELSFAVVTQWKGFRLADPVTTWCQLAAMLSVDDLIAAGDYLITGPDPLHGLPPFASREDLMAGVAAHGNRRGIRTARRALDLVRVGPRSRPESLLRVLMVTNGFPEPELNLSVRLLNGSHKEPDIVYPAIRFGIEYEGDGHRQDRALFLRDIERKEAFADIDWELMRVTSDHLKHPDELLARIRRRIHRRCLTFGVASPS